MDDRLAADHAVLCDAVRAAGAVATHYFGGPLDVREKAPGDPVSNADLAVNDSLQTALMAARPDYGWLSEESPDSPERLERDRVWMVDPIDGTKAFVRGDPGYSISVALVANGRPIAAAVYMPVDDVMVDATAGGGARRNGTVIAVTGASTLKDGTLGTGRSETGRSAWRLLEPATIAAFDSIACGLCDVAAGKYDAAASLTGKSDWDIAASDLIVDEAGGIVTDARGQPFVYNRTKTRHANVVGAPRHLLASILAAVQAT